MAKRKKKAGIEPTCYARTMCYEPSGPPTPGRELRQLAQQMRLLEQQVAEPATSPETLRYALEELEQQCRTLRDPARGKTLMPAENKRLVVLLARVQKALATLAAR